jgi:uncharacterized protein YqeY
LTFSPICGIIIIEVEKMVKKTLKCYKCKEDTLREEIVAYASPNAKVLHNYCPKCLAEK